MSIKSTLFMDAQNLKFILTHTTILEVLTVL